MAPLLAATERRSPKTFKISATPSPTKLGFGISEVALAGEHEIGRDEILVLAGITDRSSLLFLDAARTRARLLTNPWISDATVLKLYPDRLRIEIKERQPFALWQKDGRSLR